MISIHLYPIYGKVTDWPSIIPFLAFPKEVRKIIYTINSIEPVNRQIRKIIKNK
jgi:putative transposase